MLPSEIRERTVAVSSDAPFSFRSHWDSTSGEMGRKGTLWHLDKIVGSRSCRSATVKIITFPGGGSSRVLRNAFAASFVNANHVLVPDVYRSREPVDPDFSVQQIIQAMRHKDAHFVPTLKAITSFLLARLKPGDVLLVLSAGDADQVSAQVFASLSQKAAS